MSLRRSRPRRSGAPCGRCRSTGWRVRWYGRAARRDGLRHRRSRRRGIAERGLRRAHCRGQHGAAFCSRADRLGASPGNAPLRRDRRVPFITARGTASGSSTRRARGACVVNRGMPPSVWRRGTSCAYLGVSSADLQSPARLGYNNTKISMRLFKRKRSPAYATHGSGAVAEYGLRGL